MEYMGTLASIAESLFNVLENSEVKKLWSIWGYKSDLKKLEETTNKIKDLLLDAEYMQQGQLIANLSHQDQSLVRNLRHYIFDAENFLQMFIARTERRQLKAQEKAGSSITKKVRRSLSIHVNPLAEALRWSGQVKEIVSRLDTIVQDHNRLGLKCQWEPVRRIREETDSHVYDYEIIGRNNEVEEVVGRLLDDRDVEPDVFYCNIVGMGGLGKTAVANKVYNDPRIKGHFSKRLWACVSDEDPGHLDVKDTLQKIVKSATMDICEHLSLEQLQRKVQELLEGKKYLLILDDVWNENREQWIQLRRHFCGGLKGSWILVTTRSEKTANVVGDEYTLKLKGLSHDDSWRLFKSVAFVQKSEQDFPPHLAEIGKRIVKKCANVPLAIRVVGGLLYGQGKQKWLTFGEQIEFGGIEQGRNGGIKHILELSYLHLPTQLKMCFSYCVLFPKDFNIPKEMLIYLWWAQGFIVSRYDGQTIEDAGEECFSILASRSFFQDIHKGWKGRIYFKLHDLMHDLALGVVEKEIHADDSIVAHLNERVRHLCLLTSLVDTESFFTRTKIRTFLQMKKSPLYDDVDLWCHNEQHLSALLANWIYLRALDLSSTQIKKLPSAMGKLLLLRYLDLSWNKGLKRLPHSITGLHNLEILLSAHCGLEKLPEDLSKLTKLRVLDTSHCHNLRYMPRHMGQLTCLEKLPLFTVGDRSSWEQQKGLVDQLQGLKALKNIKGELCIMLCSLKKATFAMEDDEERRYLSQHQYLTNIHIDSFRDEESLEELQPHPNLIELKLSGYVGERMPNWAREHNLALFLPNLTNLTLDLCPWLQHISGIGKLPKLKSLALLVCSDLEYIENTTINCNSNPIEASESQDLFFPSLEQLQLSGLLKLRGWWRDDDNPNQQDHGLLPSFPRLSHLEIYNCSMMASMPYCPSLEDLKIEDYNANLRIMESMELGNPKLKRVKSSDVVNLKLILPIEVFQSLEWMELYEDEKVESLSDVEEMLLTCSTSLLYLTISKCSNLKKLNGGLKHLTALKTLILDSLPNLSLSTEGEEEETEGMPWHCLAHSLCSLSLWGLDGVVQLPNGMKYLSALQSLTIRACSKLEGVPEWMPELTSLKSLEIYNCSARMHERCRNPNGEDWPHIQHIPDFILDSSPYPWSCNVK